ncbi:glycerophosphodiester phosphodiesterase family protein [Puniceibacterium sediminis]|uniref:Glycerophosphoryl diester phosphodiesterase n=1 Tax=Puniceibacterium sediminis TaxID=1608407 RepID=A0A238WRG5_9RHOB|nr:glycerophosphodiester phosphodiesterase family protein [Puniceibacterium sediminis]SNR49136.1 Glycerophosphoryl diester phosphodiesterase [Puniceibacterium sediminis]
MTSLPTAFLSRPIAHRALHGPGAPENSRSAVRRAVSAGYGIEIDLQLSADGVAMVFHDYALSRLTPETGALQQRSADELARIPLKGGDETIPTFKEILALVAGQVPLLIEIKDQDGALGPSVGPLEEAAARDLAGYTGPAAVMSFNPHSVARMADLAPDLPRGLTTCAYTADDWPTIPAAIRKTLREIPDFDRVGASFISHDAADLRYTRVAALKHQGAAILCWTIRSAEAEAEARKVAHNVTFEGYTA